ncbi:hypothetical protein OBBRIDRAFT_592990 [Obba rivulosa]|uniref:Uncharacterized protein n=1 Tax=Obba rivulosa TaxID=1052685 RepID=A0A8E2AUE0_9APHY|nr:hypothetical protein OBBRIDRAFT_592990 [Obba rivulosa]
MDLLDSYEEGEEAGAIAVESYAAGIRKAARKSAPHLGRVLSDLSGLDFCEDAARSSLFFVCAHTADIRCIPLIYVPTVESSRILIHAVKSLTASERAELLINLRYFWAGNLFSDWTYKDYVHERLMAREETDTIHIVDVEGRQCVLRRATSTSQPTLKSFNRANRLSTGVQGCSTSLASMVSSAQMRPFGWCMQQLRLDTRLNGKPCTRLRQPSARRMRKRGT